MLTVGAIDLLTVSALVMDLQSFHVFFIMLDGYLMNFMRSWVLLQSDRIVEIIMVRTITNPNQYLFWAALVHGIYIFIYLRAHKK